ncbi:MAG TPA: MFS transporter [Gammaproteobacteria bacterium]|nr:MFS transporter [Gammaproteobacteria bacterium]
MINRNILILFFSQVLAFSTGSFLVLVVGILAPQLSPTQELATLPLALMAVSIALATIPAVMLMQRLGRKAGIILSYLAAIAGTASGFMAIRHSSFILLCLCTVLNGVFYAVANQFRFAAIESAPDKTQTGQVVSFMLFGGVIAAFLGPQLADWGKDLFEPAFSGSFTLLIAALVVSLIIFSRFRAAATVNVQVNTEPTRPLGEIMRQPLFIVAMTSGAVSFAVMSFLMTATPISMHHIDGFSFEQSRQVIQWHIAAMYLPSVFSIFLFRFFSIAGLMLCGAIIYILLAILALQGHGFMHYSGALILLGVGWNFLFVSGTTLLPQCYRAGESFKAQALNDFNVFGIQAVCSLSAGWVLFTLGWDAMVWMTLPASALMLALAIFYYLKNTSLTKAQSHKG